MINYILKHTWLFYLIQFTWGILMNIFGLIVALVMLITLHKPERFGPSIYFRCHKYDGGAFEAGMFFVIGKTADSCKEHEAGHGLQNLWWGPLMPFVISIPSMIRFWYREIFYYNRGKRPKTGYDDIWFEGQATNLGKKYYRQFKKD